MKYGIVYKFDGAIEIVPHFCREWDDDEGCYGTNPDHGMTWKEARTEVADFHLERAKYFRTLKEPKP